MQWTAAEIAVITGGRVFGSEHATASGATQDSRDVQPGMLFVPLVAERDGHDFIGAAVAAGATAYVTANGESETDNRPGPATAIAVADTHAAMVALAADARARLGDTHVVGITGSAGKTTTKDLLSAILSQDRSPHVSVRSFNNEIGVPLTLINAPSEADVLVLELGSRGAGHIARLCELAQPNIGLITTVGLAHTSEFGSLGGVVAAKRELIEALPSSEEGGLAVLNAGVPEVASMADFTAARVVTFGDGGDIHARAADVDNELVPRFRLASPVGEVDVVLGARGLHLVDNALGAAAVAIELGVSLDHVAAGLAAPVLSPLRMELVSTSAGARILNDTYNANPLSMSAALRSLASLPAQRRTAVVGLMAELGDLADEEHAAIGAMAGELGVRLISVATSAYGGEDVADVASALVALGPLDAGDAILVKGSRVAGLEQLVELLVSSDSES